MSFAMDIAKPVGADPQASSSRCRDCTSRLPGEHRPGLSHGQRAARREDRTGMPLVNSSWMHQAIGRHDLALELLYIAMRPTPNYARAYVNRAEVHEATGNLARVLTDLQKAESLISAASDNRQEDPWRPAGNARQSSQHKRTRYAAKPRRPGIHRHA